MNCEAIDRYLDANQAEEAVQRHTLARGGPSLVENIVSYILIKLRSFRDGLEHFFAGPITEVVVRQVFDRATDLLLEIINTSPQGGYAVGQQLIPLMEHKDPGMRALATVFSGLPGIPFSLTTKPLQNRCLNDEDFVVKIAAAVHLQRSAERASLLPAEVRSFAQHLVASYFEQSLQGPGSTMTLDDDDFEAEEDRDPEKAMRQSMLGTVVVLQHIPRMIALQGEGH